ncbi:MAG: ATP-dependent sacrificial sulfur transferase LarE [Methanolinea sp.]|nr:ATP-dependent sacrificial sulfur transferase LarE [Methanolinea sp.]
MAENDCGNSEILLERLKDRLRANDRLLISYSGGVDSSFLTYVAKDCVPGGVVCVLLDSPLLPRQIVEDAKQRAYTWDVPLEIVSFPILEDGAFHANGKDRCYICKKKGAGILRDIARRRGIVTIADGVNKTDLREFRPGIRAMDEAGIVHPLAASGLEKDDIRTLSQMLGLPFSCQPSFPCLATRIPYGTMITTDMLQVIEQAESFLRSLGFSVLRVRLHGECARIEVPPGDMPLVLRFRTGISKRFRELGIPHTCLDLPGYRSGSMDENGIIHSGKS